MATLQERIKEEIVLRRGQVRDRQWRQSGLMEEAAREGIAAEDFRRLVNELSRQINFEKLTDLRRRLEEALSAPPAYQLHQTQTDDFVAEAERMGLSAPFVRDRWIPELIGELKKNAPATPEPVTPATGSAPVAPEPIVPTPPPAPVSPPLGERVSRVLDGYDGHITARELRLLFRAIDADERQLADEVLAYLSAHFYASEQEPQGTTLREKILSTDWRHVSWWDKKPASTPSPDPAPAYVPPVVEPRPAPGTPPPVSRPENVQPNWQPTPEPPRRSNAGLWGAIFAVAVLLILYLLIKPSQRKARPDREPTPATTTERTKSSRKAERDPEPVREERAAPKPDRETEESVATDDRSNNPEPAPVATPAEDKPVEDGSRKPAQKYDRLLETTGEFGEHPARLNKKWGLWRDNDWLIYPIYDDITTFRDGRATVVRSGRTYDIDDKGNPIEN